MDKTNEEVELEEARGSSYPLYHKSYTDAINHAIAHHKDLHVSDEDRMHYVGIMSKKPSEGNTTSVNLPATHRITGKPNMIHIQVFNRGNKASHPYELNTYSSGIGRRIKEEVELDEVYQNHITQNNKLGSASLGQPLKTGHKLIGTLPNGHEVHFRTVGSQNQYRVVDPKTKKVNTVLTTKPQAGGAEEIDTLAGNEDSGGAHHLYQHLVLKHDKVLSSNNQSAGARRVWAKAASHRSIGTHGYDPKTNTSFHAKPDEDEHYSTDDEYDNLVKDRDTSKRDKRKYEKEIGDVLANDDKYIVMHKKSNRLKEDYSKLYEKWSEKYKKSIDCGNPKGFSQRAHCQGLKKEDVDTANDRPVSVARGKESRKKTQNVERDLTPQTPSNDAKNPKNPVSDAYKQQQIKNKIIDENSKKTTTDPNKPSSRMIGTDSLVKTYKKATPGQCIDEAFNIAFASGIGVTLTSKDLGMQMQSSFEHHPSVLAEMERLRLEQEFEEDVVAADRVPVVVPPTVVTVTDPETGENKTYTRKGHVKYQKSQRKIISSGNPYDGQPG